MQLLIAMLLQSSDGLPELSSQAGLLPALAETLADPDPARADARRQAAFLLGAVACHDSSSDERLMQVRHHAQHIFHASGLCSPRRLLCQVHRGARSFKANRCPPSTCCP